MTTNIHVTPQSDFIILCDNTRFHVSRSILSSSSKVWSAMLLDDTSTEVPFTNISVSILHQVLLLCHNQSTVVSHDQLEPMLAVAFQYDIPQVTKYCETHLSGSPIDIFRLGDKYHSPALLHRGGQGLIKDRNPYDLKSFSKASLLNLISIYADYTQSQSETIDILQCTLDINRKNRMMNRGRSSRKSHRRSLSIKRY